jgi:1-acyl-sn-glycerol-3-phosphate acyltransferase
VTTSTESKTVQSSRAYRLAYPYLRALLRILVRIFAPRFRATGMENIPRRGAFILAPNHIADADPPFVYNAVMRPLWFMAKSEIFKISWLGPPIRFFQAFEVDPGEPDREALKFAQRVLESGHGLMMFPEGRISESGELGEILAGAVLLALKSDATVIPVGVWGTQHVIPYGKMMPRPTLQKVRVHYGPPLRFDDLKTLPKREQREAAAQRLEQAMRAAREVSRR